MEKAYKLEFQNEMTGALYLICCGCSRTEPLHSFGPALKPHYLIHYVMSGRGRFVMDGKEYPLEAGAGFYIEPGELTFYQADEAEPWTYVWIGFSGTCVDDYMRSMGLSKEHPVFASDASGELYQTVKDMMEHNTCGFSNSLRRDGLLGIFLSIIARTASVQEAGESSRANDYVSRAVDFVKSNYCNPIRVTDVADYVCVHRSYLYTLFQNHIGMSPQQFLTSFRIAKAVELLQMTELPIESIAISVGYTDPLVFTKAFRQTKGISPSGYRKEYLQSGTRHRQSDLEQIEAFLNERGVGAAEI
ncbi:MAG: AraC family transcriptional regulator [Lachnospiraceae bacterium]|nr:AraC family transcriptional regulator [Lachnospiraceae bacterium]MDE7239208.1 AraC family transcriptional regulator [Lachnospiraceae bacterium]